VARCFLGDSCTGIVFFFLSFFSLGTFLIDVGFSLGDLGALGIAVGSSILTTTGVDPLEVIVPPILVVSTGADMKLLRRF